MEFDSFVCAGLETVSAEVQDSQGLETKDKAPAGLAPTLATFLGWCDFILV